MVIQKGIDNLKGRPKDERVAVASGVALAVVAILFFGWIIYFFHKIQSGAITPTLDSGTQDEFNPAGVQQAQQALQQEYNSVNSDLTQLPSDAAAQQVQPIQQAQVQQYQTGTDQFGLPNSGNQ
jgi:uncharacterized protein HemX